MLVNPELKACQDLAAIFANKELTPSREANDRYPFGPFWDDVLTEANEVGFFSVCVPCEIGGTGQGMSALCTILLALCQADASLGGIIFTNTAAQEIILSGGCEEYLASILAEAAQARDFLLAFPSFNNPDEMKPALKARKNGDHYTLVGTLEYLVLGGLAKYALVPAFLDGQTNYTFFLLNLNDAGIKLSQPIFSLGLHACPAVDAEFNGAPARLIGAEGQGSRYFSMMADKMNTAAAAMGAGIMQGSFNEAFAYCKERFQGGKPIAQWSEVQMILSGIAVRAKAAEMIVAQAMAAVDAREAGWAESSRAAAIHILEMACDVTTDGIQMLGGYGYMKDYGQEKRFRDAKQIQALLGLHPMKKLSYIRSMLAE
ncbi:MAG: acyl-CoA dehydrogenase family protein [Candidatus Saccharibacteria bacterium]